MPGLLGRALEAKGLQRDISSDILQAFLSNFCKKMKEKIFLLSYKALNWFSISPSPAFQRKISNWANLFFLTLADGGRFTLRGEEAYKVSRDFVKCFLFQEKGNEKIANLKKDLDADSQKLIDRNIKRQEYIFTHNLLDNRSIFDLDELKEQKLVYSFRNHSLRNKKNTYSGTYLYPESFYYHNGLKALPKDVLEKIGGKDVIDGGAFTGDSAIIFCKNYSFGKIHSFEPDKFNFIKLKENIAKYKMENVIPVKKGISSGEGKATLKIQGVASLISPEGSEEIEITSIDKYVEHSNPDINIGLIKFDIEGSEFEGIVGSLNTIKKFKPILLISIYHTSKDFFEIKPLLESLNLGYKFMIRKINPNSSIGEVMLIAFVAI